MKPVQSTPVNRRMALSALGAATIASCGGSGNASGGGSATTDASLSGLSISSVSLTPGFTAGTSVYASNVPNSVASVTLTVSAANSGATIRVNGTVVTSGGSSAAIALSVGVNTLNIVVTAADGATTRSYTITLTRANATAGSCVLIPNETDGPFPLYLVLANSQFRRQDVREDRTGVPLQMQIDVVNINNNCAPIANAWVYLWHCDKDGNYSGYMTDPGRTFLRGVQQVDSAGRAIFTTVFPGWYQGRVTHIHFQVYLTTPSLGTATATSQLAFERTITNAVNDSPLYAARGRDPLTVSSDMLFAGDGAIYQLAAVTGSVANGYVATLQVGIAA